MKRIHFDRTKFTKENLILHFKRNWKKYLIILGTLLILFLITWIFVVSPARALQADMSRLVTTGKTLKSDAQKRDLNGINSGLIDVQSALNQTRADFQRLKYLSHVPIIKNYYNDGLTMFAIADHGIAIGNIATSAIEPYRGILGFDQEGSKMTTEEQLLQVAQISPQLIPALDEIKGEMRSINDLLGQIDISKYPDSYKGINITETYLETQSQIAYAEELITDIEPILPEIPTALGEPDPKNYLVLFQNDKELRPTGGFITFYAFVKFEAGKFTITDSGNIYAVDSGENILPVPEPILQYLKVSKFFLRDSNFSPDYPESIKTFEQLYPYTGLPAYDGVIAIDTQFVESLLRITGPVNMDQYSLDFTGYSYLPDSCQTGGTDFTAENVVCRLELYTDKILKGGQTRKRIIGDLMGEIVDKVLNMKGNKVPELLSVGFGQLDEKHMLIYLNNETLQAFVKDRGWAGTIDAVEDGVDYLHVNDANLAGLKSDMYLKRTVGQEISIQDDGSLIKTVTLTYENPEPQDGWLNAVARNYVRVYVPLGSELISFEGDITRDAGMYEDLGKTVFDNFILIPPLESRIVTITYKLPFKLSGSEYKLFIQKQPGKSEISYTIKIGDSTEEFLINEDTEISISAR